MLQNALARVELALRAVAVAGLVALSAAVFTPAPAAAGGTVGCETDCECVEEFEYCTECTDPDDDFCIVAHCDETGECHRTMWHQECPDESEEPEWVEECDAFAT